MSPKQEHQLAPAYPIINMKSFIALLALAAVAVADVSHLQDQTAQILRQETEVNPDSYNFAYETSNGIAAQESGSLKNAGRDGEALSVQGSNQFTAPSGEQFKVTFVADKNGYQPQGAHLPTPPAPQPIPEYIARAIEWIRAHPPKEEVVYQKRN